MSTYTDVIIAGFGGQGVLLIGNLLAQAGLEAGLNVTFIPVYGAEMRGGTANCTVVVSAEEIGSPIIKRPKSLIVMNQPSLDKFQPRLEKGGIQIVNADMVDTACIDTKRTRSYPVKVNTLAEAHGGARTANMVALGAYLAATRVVPLKAAVKALDHVIGSHYAKLIPLNAAAINAGWDAVQAM